MPAGVDRAAAQPGPLDAYLKCPIKRATAGWVAALLGATSFEEAVPTINGSSAMVEFLAPMRDAESVVHRQIAWASLVVNERTDRFTFGETRFELTVLGVFEVVDGKITLWRDYCGLHTMTEQVPSS